MLADLILVNTKSSRFYPRQNAEAHVLYSACSQDISMTMIDGRIVYENGKNTILRRSRCWRILPVRQKSSIDRVGAKEKKWERLANREQLNMGSLWP